MKKIILPLIVILLSACTIGGAMTPKQKVSEFLDKYKNQDQSILSQLEEVVNNEYPNTDYRDRYKKLMTNQYKNLEYNIKDEIIEDKNAVVEVEITVYDYATAIKNANEFLNSNQGEFMTTPTIEITDANDDTVTVVTGNNPTISLEIANIDGNDVYDFMIEFLTNAPTGEDANDETSKDTNNKVTSTYDQDKFINYKLTQMENVTNTVTYTIQFTLTKVNNEWQMDALSNADMEKIYGIYVS